MRLFEDLCRRVEGDEVGDDEEVDVGLPGEAIELKDAAHVGEGLVEVEVHLEAYAYEAAALGERWHRERGASL